MDRKRPKPRRRVWPTLLLLPLSAVLALDSCVYAMPPMDRETGVQPPCHTALGIDSPLGRLAELFSPAGAIALAVRAWRRRKAGEEEDEA